jgi:hypothetical protein
VKKNVFKIFLGDLFTKGSFFPPTLQPSKKQKVNMNEGQTKFSSNLYILSTGSIAHIRAMPPPMNCIFLILRTDDDCPNTPFGTTHPIQAEEAPNEYQSIAHYRPHTLEKNQRRRQCLVDRWQPNFRTVTPFVTSDHHVQNVSFRSSPTQLHALPG